MTMEHLEVVGIKGVEGQLVEEEGVAEGRGGARVLRGLPVRKGGAVGAHSSAPLRTASFARSNVPSPRAGCLLAAGRKGSGEDLGRPQEEIKGVGLLLCGCESGVGGVLASRQ